MTEEEEKAAATEEEVKVVAKVGAVRAAAAIMGAVRGRRWGRPPGCQPCCCLAPRRPHRHR